MRYIKVTMCVSRLCFFVFRRLGYFAFVRAGRYFAHTPLSYL